MTTRSKAPSHRAGAGARTPKRSVDGAVPTSSGKPAASALSVTQDTRRTQMQKAALEVVVERGFAETRIADVAQRAKVSPALLIYYFKTKDSLLTEAIRYAEDMWYDEGARRMADIDSAAGRLEEIVAMNCLPQYDEIGDSWAIWLDLWATAVRHPEVRKVREEFDERWRETIRRIVRDGQEAGEFAEVDVEDFAVGFSALLDGFAIQIALKDPVVSAEKAFELSMQVAAQQLGYEWDPRERSAHKKAKPARRRPR